MDKEKSLVAQRAAEWLDRLEHASPEERAEFVKWLKRSPQHGWEILLATSSNILLQHLMKSNGITLRDIGSASSNVSPIHGFRSTKGPSPVRASIPTSVSRRSRAWSFGTVLALAALISLVTIVIEIPPDHAIVTAASEWRDVRLEDGTLLRAGPRTEVSVEMTAHRRLLRLARGKIMVYVAKDTTRPLYVEADLVSARAVGTAFAVKLSDAKSVSVTVQQGTVAVARRHALGADDAQLTSPNTAMLRAGEGVTVDADGAALLARPADLNRDLAWVDEKLIAGEHSTVADLVHEFNLNNALQIELRDRTVATRQMRGTFRLSDPALFVRSLERQFPVAVVESRGALRVVPHPRSTSDQFENVIAR